MSQIEELTYSAELHGKKTEFIKTVNKFIQEEPNEYLDSIYIRAYQSVMNTQMKKNKKISKLSNFKKKKPLERKIADDLVKKSEQNEKLREKNIGTSFLDLF